MKLYSNEIVFRGHPDKLMDATADAILDAYISKDPNTRAGIEATAGKDVIFITGEVSSYATVDIEAIVARVLEDTGYNPEEFKIINNIGIQSPDIAQGVDIGGAGDQGMMFGFACNETDKLLPKAMVILQEFSKAYDKLRQRHPGDFYADGKCQITGYYDSYFNLNKVKTFTISYQNPENNRDWTDKIIKGLATSICNDYGIEIEEFLINPTGKFNIGGPKADAGVVGRKIVVDSYQSFAPVGGGAFSGKDPTKVDRSAAYKARQLAIRALRKYGLTWCNVQLSYAIGVARPLAIYIDSNNGNIDIPEEWYDECIPENIIKEFNMNNPIYEQTARFGHFGNGFIWDK